MSPFCGAGKRALGSIIALKGIKGLKTPWFYQLFVVMLQGYIHHKIWWWFQIVVIFIPTWGNDPI